MRFKILIPIIIIAVSVIPLLDLFHRGLPVTHDGQDHVARIAAFYKNLEEGNIIPRWAGNLNWGYGHPILMFLYPLPSYTASLFHFMGFSFIDSVKLVFGASFILSGIFMFIWLKEFLSKEAALVGASMYILAPYRFVDLYVRGAIGEHVAFIFPPLILFFLLKLSKKLSFGSVVGGSFSFAGLILSHNAISLMFLPVIFLYALYLLWQKEDKSIIVRRFVFTSLLGFGLAAFFWMPAFFEGKYTLRDIVTTGEYSTRFVALKSFFSGTWNYGGTGQFTTQVGVVQWIAMFGSFFAISRLYKVRNNLWIIATGAIVIFSITLFLMTDSSRPLWQIFTTLQKFQFPWRFLSITVFITAVLGSLAVSVIPKQRQLLVLVFSIFALLWFNKDYWHANDYSQKEDNFYTGVYRGTTDTGESSPIWSVRFMEKEPKQKIEFITGSGKIEELKRTSTYHEYKIEVKERSRIRENTLYFPGWEVLVDGNKLPIEFQDPSNRGLLTFYVDSGSHVVKTVFVETKLRQIADLTTIASIISLLALFLGWKKIVQKRAF